MGGVQGADQITDRREMNATDRVGEENNERIVMDNEMMDYEWNPKVTPIRS